MSIADCVHVAIGEDVPPELLRQRLVSVTDCVSVACTEEQRAAMEPVAEDVVDWGQRTGQDQAGDQGDGDTVLIRSAFCTL